jgi:hypothetical protein
MYILAYGDADQLLKDFIWIKEDEFRTNLEDLEGKITNKKEFKDKIFNIFLLKEYTNNRTKDMKLILEECSSEE